MIPLSETSKRGGKRPNAGRKPSGKTTVVVRVSTDLLPAIEALKTGKAQETRSLDPRNNANNEHQQIESSNYNQIIQDLKLQVSELTLKNINLKKNLAIKQKHFDQQLKTLERKYTLLKTKTMK